MTDLGGFTGQVPDLVPKSALVTVPGGPAVPDLDLVPAMVPITDPGGSVKPA